MADISAADGTGMGNPSPGGRRLLVHAGVILCLTVGVLGGMWLWVWGPRYHRIMKVAYAKVGLREMAQLQQIYHLEKARYADDVLTLATASVNPNGFLRDTGHLLDVKSLVFANSQQSFAITAQALDDAHTVVRIAGDEHAIRE